MFTRWRLIRETLPPFTRAPPAPAAAASSRARTAGARGTRLTPACPTPPSTRWRSTRKRPPPFTPRITAAASTRARTAAQHGRLPTQGSATGTIFALAIDPKTTSTIYAGDYYDGVFKSTERRELLDCDQQRSVQPVRPGAGRRSADAFDDLRRDLRRRCVQEHGRRRHVGLSSQNLTNYNVLALSHRSSDRHALGRDLRRRRLQDDRRRGQLDHCQRWVVQHERPRLGPRSPASRAGSTQAPTTTVSSRCRHSHRHPGGASRGLKTPWFYRDCLAPNQCAAVH